MLIIANKFTNRSRITLIILLIVFSFWSVGCTVEKELAKKPLDLSKLNWNLEAQIALQKAEEIFKQVKDAGQDLSKGPCLSNELSGNAAYPETVWVLDIAHNPREAIDDFSENQCPAFREGRARNFIELDLNGQVIQIYSPYLK